MRPQLVIPLTDPRRGHFPLGNEPRVVAAHESGHAVAGVVLGQKVALVRPRLTSYRAPPRTMREFYRAALVTLAGPCAEDRFCCYTRDQRAELRSRRCDPRSNRVLAVAAQNRRSIGRGLKACPR